MQVRPLQIFQIIAWIVLILASANLLMIYHVHFGLVDRRLERTVEAFHFDQEGNIPTIFSFLLLLGSAVILWLISHSHRLKGESWIPWKGLAIIFIYLAVDEAIQIHEMFNELTSRFSGTLASGIKFPWVIPYSILVVIFGLVYLPFLMRLPKYFRKMFVLSGLVFVTGAIGFELLGGKRIDVAGEDFVYGTIMTLEETLEMTGVGLFIYTLLSYMASKKFQVKLVPVSPPNLEAEVR